MAGVDALIGALVIGGGIYLMFGKAIKKFINWINKSPDDNDDDVEE